MIAALQSIVTHLGMHADVYTLFTMFFLVFARVAGALSQVPFLGGPSVPGQAKIGLSAIITSIMLPSLGLIQIRTDITSMLFLGLLVKELVIGLTIGIMAQMIFYAIQAAGIVIDQQRGMNQISYLAPQLPGHTSALGNFQFQAALVVFLAMNGHLIFLRVLGQTFELLPVLSFPHLAPGLLPIMSQVARIGANVLLVAAQLSAPVVLAMFLVDMAFACIGKATPSLRLHGREPDPEIAGRTGFSFLCGGVPGGPGTDIPGADDPVHFRPGADPDVK